MSYRPRSLASSVGIALILICNLWYGEVSAETVLSWGQHPAHLVSKHNYLFWSDASETPIKKTPICGGETIPLAKKMGVPANVAIQRQYIFWIDERTGISPSGSCSGGGGVTWVLNKSLLDGTSTTELARGDHCSGNADDIAVDETDVYWVNSTVSSNEFTIKKVPIAGGDSTTLVTSQWTPIVALTSDATHIYWAEDTYPEDPPSSTIKNMPKNGGQIEIVASGLKAIRGGLAVYGGEIFFADNNYFDTLRFMKVSVSGGSVTTLATVIREDLFEPKNDVKALAVDNENLYWVDKNDVNAVPVSGGSITTLAGILNEPIDIALSAGQVFWTESTGPAHGETGTVKSVSSSGVAVTTLVQGGAAPRKLFLYGDVIYLTEGGPIGLIEGFGRIAEIPAGGGNLATVILGVMSDSPPITSDGRYIYIADHFSIKKVSIDGRNTQKLYGAYDEIGDLVTDGSNVYWISRVFSTVHKIPVSGGPVTTLSSELVGLSGPIRVRNGYVYWIANHETINKVNVGGGQVITLATDLPFLNDLVVDDTHVYFSEHDARRIRRISINGGQIATVASYLSYPPIYLAIDDLSLYWISQIQVAAISKADGSQTVIDYNVLSDPYFDGSLAVDPTGLYWTETAFGVIMKYNFGICRFTSEAMPCIPLLLLDD